MTDEKDVSVHEAEISEASIPVEERKEEFVYKSREHKRELKDLQADVKYHKIYHTKKTKSDNEGATILPANELECKKKKRMISKLIPALF